VIISVPSLHGGRRPADGVAGRGEMAGVTLERLAPPPLPPRAKAWCTARITRGGQAQRYLFMPARGEHADYRSVSFSSMRRLRALASALRPSAIG